MKAIDFYNRLLNYDDESKETGKYYYGFSNGTVTIHRIGDNTEYILYKKGIYMTISPDLSLMRNRNIDELKGDDFELYSKIQCFKCGYLKYNNTSTIKDIISKIRSIFNNIDFFGEEKEDKLILNNATFIDGYSDGFSYSLNNESETYLELCTIPYICKENINRSYYGVKCFPFIKNIRNNEAIYVKVNSTVVPKRSLINIQEECDIAIKELLTYTEGAKWIDCKINKPIYY